MISQTLGWTLIHSLWEGLTIYVILKVALRSTPRADVRYGMNVAAMALLVVSSVATFFVLNRGSESTGFQLVLNASQAKTSGATFSILSWVDANIIWFIRFWVLGLSVGLLRIAVGLWYIGRLRRNAHPVQEEWMDMVRRLSESLNVNRVVAMAEAGISSPMVVGFMKPIILFPVGLLSGLSAEQVETILVHELSHIRRQDYIINLVQSVIETIFFFNPFALLISSSIREERENCCDDMVIAKGVSPISYVKTLAQLEAARSSSTLAVAFTGNQNQLLNRIKRIMENSAKNDWGKGRLVPVALLFLGLVCASWLSISSEKEIQSAKSIYKVAAQDTSREDGLVVIKRGRGHNSWVVEEPVPAIEPIPEIEFVPDMHPIPDVDPMDFAMAFEFPPVPFEFGEFMQWDSLNEFTFYGPDSIPAYDFHLREPVDWELFEKEFTEKFQSQYKDFFEKNKDQIKKMIEDSKHEEAARREAAEIVDLAQLKQMSDMSYKMIDAQMAMQAQQMHILDDQLRNQNLLLEEMAQKTDDYMKALTDMLADDGYIKKGDDLDGLHIQDMDGKMTINGNKIKEKDMAKYRALHDAYFQTVPRSPKAPRYPGRNE